MEFKLPELGEGVNEGELVKWLVKPGDQIVHDQPLCEVMTDKATVEIPSPYDLKVKELHFKEGDTVEVGQVLITFESVGGEAKASKAEETQPAAPAKETKTKESSNGNGASRSEAPMAVGSSSPSDRVLAAPATRRLAREKGVNLAEVRGSGEHGRVLREDVEHFLGGGSAGVSPSPVREPSVPRSYPQGGEQRVPFKGLRKKISEKMRLSKDKAAHFTYVEEADATELVKLRKHAKEVGQKSGIKVTFLPFIMKAMVAALRQYPILNSSLDEEAGELVYKHYYNIGLSIQTEDGLTAPVVKNVEHKSVMELAKDIQDIVDRARNKKLQLDDFKGSTITLTNAGSIGGLFATPVINYPEVAILGFNKIFRKPVVREMDGKEEIVIRDWTYFSISLDHRVVDGAVGAEFMKAFIQYIENPSLLLLESF